MESPKDTVWIINPDLLAKRIAEHEKLVLNDANLEAVKRIEKWLYTSVSAYQTIGVETVLSSDKYRRLVITAKEAGFQVNLIYVYLETVDLNIERVKLRVKRGGHDVSEDKIRERRERSFEQLEWFFEAADEAYIFDNSGAEPKMMSGKKGPNYWMYSGLIPEISTRLSPNIPSNEI